MSTWAVPGYSESRELGSGASGRVALAVHEETGHPVAVKYLSESLRTRPGFVHEFRAEARLLGGLRSAHVAGLYEYVEGPEGAAIVMELVDGVSLRALLAREAPLDPEAALVLLKGSLLGLADAHRVGVVHRDYKPENVLVRPDGTSKLVDFGIAATDGTTAGIAGTPSYMAPEQWTGAPASPAADVYAATATFFECLTGRKPYTGGNLAELALQHVDGAIPADEVPEPVRSLVQRGLAKSPEQRPAHAEDFVAELEATAGGAYGPDWEERGRGRLAALAALSLLLLPSVPSVPRRATDTARTILGGTPDWLRAWQPSLRTLLVSGAALVAALLLTYGIDRHAPDFGTPRRAAEALATTSAQPTGGSGPTASADPGSPTPSSSSATSDAPTPSGSATDSTAQPTVSASATAGASTSATVAPPTSPAATTSEPTTTSPSPTIGVNVKSVTFSGFRQTGTATAAATATVTTDGTGPVTITVAWFTGEVSGQAGAQDGATETYQRSGSTQYTIALGHTFQGAGCYWGVQARTQPASADGGAWQQLLTRRCMIS
ncbi:serine/threonine-protein kinase [Streptomyces rhizosphaerihabitans]|uniref:serine/threonine-protein kinase n=1 Tax=Streptomyces rhizosphaerihabitans TaxID=1266770 RepID=UPI0021BF500C|nr:serine/threonine-protein kinase [Streptomyces rhizosphaerihabitans]MCT9007714.1 serine/threonine protein kinase [Streptomyces rhizosphaerihabitans]